MIPPELLAHIDGASWFRKGSSPYLVLDTDLRIRAVNAAYEQATGSPRSVMVEERLFDVFPDNPGEPSADGVANLGGSLERVFRRGQTHWMGVQRYDVPAVWDRSIFVKKVWAPVNHPIRVGGRVVGAVHHVHDVTFAMSSMNGEPSAPDDLSRRARWLAHRFPTVSFDAILGVLAQADVVVLKALGSRDVEHSNTLATLRLESIAGRPASTAATA